MSISYVHTTDLDSPAETMQRLSAIERDLAVKQNSFEQVTGQWYAVQRDVKRASATALLSSNASSVTEKRAEADLAGLVVDGAECEALYESLKAALRVLEARSMILMSLLRSQGRI